jgi:hypothetical protein
MHKTILIKFTFCLTICLVLNAIPKKSSYNIVSLISKDHKLESFPIRIESFEKLLQLHGGEVKIGKKVDCLLPNHILK